MQITAKVKKCGDDIIEISTNEVLPKQRLVTVQMKQADVCPACDAVYDEAFLAKQRTKMKEYEATNEYVLLDPIPSFELDSQEKTQEFIQTMTHAARRLKDCSCVIGFCLPSFLEEKDKQALKTSLLAKHPHYIFV